MATIKDFGRWMYDHRATLMSWGATAGTIGGSVLSVKAAPKAIDRIDHALAEKKRALGYQMVEEMYDTDDIMEAQSKVKLTLWEKVKAGGPAFIPAILVEVATIGCIHGSNCANKTEIRKGKEALAVALAGFAAYQESVGVISDRTTEFAAAKRVEQMRESKERGEPPWDEVRRFRLDGQGEFFERTMEQVFKAEFEANRLFALRGYVTVNDFRQMLDLPDVDDGNDVGWHDYIGEVYYGYHWIDFSHLSRVDPNGNVYTDIHIPFGPHPLDEDEANAELEKVFR